MSRVLYPLLGLGLLLAELPALAQDKKAGASSRIYSCTLADGRRLTSDRPIPECLTREQQLHRSDGSVRGALPPAMSLEERAAAELREREAATRRAALADAVRHDRNLLSRYPRQARHDAARQEALDDVIKATELSERRIKELASERKKLDDEAEFYKGRQLPAKLKQQLDANDASVEAQRLIISQQGAEQARVNRRYDAELSRLKRLWAGAPPGSLGPPPSGRDLEAAAATPPASATVKPAASSSATR